MCFYHEEKKQTWKKHSLLNIAVPRAEEISLGMSR